MEDINEFINSNEIEITFSPSDANPFMPGQNSDLDHWFCNLTTPNTNSFDFYFSATNDIKPEPEMVLARLIDDIDKYKECNGYSDFIALFDTSEGEGEAELAVAWAELERLAPLVEQLLNRQLTIHAP